MEGAGYEQQHQNCSDNKVQPMVRPGGPLLSLADGI